MDYGAASSPNLSPSHGCLAKESKVVITWVEEVAELFYEAVDRNATWPANQNA
jgi:hypothetical protein